MEDVTLLKTKQNSLAQTKHSLEYTNFKHLVT
jgi:hypothetical protein